MEKFYDLKDLSSGSAEGHVISKGTVIRYFNYAEQNGTDYAEETIFGGKGEWKYYRLYAVGNIDN